jgi:hypothetical protein
MFATTAICKVSTLIHRPALSRGATAWTMDKRSQRRPLRFAISQPTHDAKKKQLNFHIRPASGCNPLRSSCQGHVPCSLLLREQGNCCRQGCTFWGATCAEPVCYLLDFIPNKVLTHQ